jgi:hypothetical protein
MRIVEGIIAGILLVGWILFIWFLLTLAVVGCGSTEETHRTIYTEDQTTKQQIKDLKEKVDQLSLLTDSFTSGITNPFEDCATVTNAMERKICEIAQTFNASNQLEMTTQLGLAAKEFQKALFGEDCVNNTDPGCPVSGSVTSRLSAAETALANNSASISAIQSTLTTVSNNVDSLLTRVTALESRLNNFNGSGQTAEVFVAAIRSDVTALQTTVASIQGLLSSDRILKTYSLCGDNISSGPIYELIAITGDKTKAYGYVKTGTAEGMGMFFKAGDANKFASTHINSKTCNFKMYNDTTNTKIQACWISTNRSATAAQIDAARTAATATCTDY